MKPGSRYLTSGERRLVADIVRSVSLDHQVAEATISNPLVSNLFILTPGILEQHGGMCLFRAFCGEAALVALGITDYQLVIGGLLYRAGPDPVRDCAGFADGEGRGGFLEDGSFFGHTWLQVGANFVDFSSGDWKAVALAAQEAGTDNIQHIPDLAPMVWETTPPEFIWQYRARLEPTREACGAEARKNGGYLAPPLGHAWYMGFDETRYADGLAMIQRFRAAAHENPAMMAAVKHIITQIIEHFGRRPSASAG
jgi:hypothetical protein